MVPISSSVKVIDQSHPRFEQVGVVMVNNAVSENSFTVKFDDGQELELEHNQIAVL